MNLRNSIFCETKSSSVRSIYHALQSNEQAHKQDESIPLSILTYVIKAKAHTYREVQRTDVPQKSELPGSASQLPSHLMWFSVPRVRRSLCGWTRFHPVLSNPSFSCFTIWITYLSVFSRKSLRSPLLGPLGLGRASKSQNLDSFYHLITYNQISVTKSTLPYEYKSSLKKSTLPYEYFPLLHC